MNLADVHTPKCGGYAFGGVDVKKFCAEMRRWLDDVEGGRTQLTEIRLIQRSTTDDFYNQSLIIRFAEQIAKPDSPPFIAG